MLKKKTRVSKNNFFRSSSSIEATPVKPDSLAEHNYFKQDTSLEHELEKSLLREKRYKAALNRVTAQKRKLEQTVKSLSSSVSSLEDLLKDISKKEQFSSDFVKHLNECASAIPSELLKRTVKKIKHSNEKEAYHPALRQFSLTLHLYSAKAYRKEIFHRNHIFKDYDYILL